MAEIDYEIFHNMVFPPNDRWAEEGVSAKALAGLRGEELARAEALLLSVLPTSLDSRPFEAAGLLGLAAAAPLLRRRVADHADDLRAAAQNMVIAAAGALRRLGQAAVAEEAFLRAWRLIASAPFGNSDPTLAGPWGSLWWELKEWPPSPAIMGTLLAFIADESFPSRVDAEFAALAPADVAPRPAPHVAPGGRPTLRQQVGDPSPAVWLRHVQTSAVGLERIWEPFTRGLFVMLLEDMGATAAGRAALAGIAVDERATLEEWLRHRLIVHDDRHGLLSLGFLHSWAALSPLEDVMRRRAGEYDAAAAAVARHLIDGFDALPTVEQVIHAGSKATYPDHYANHRARAVRLLAYLPLNRAAVKRLLLGILDNDDGYACYELLRSFESLAATAVARERLAAVQVSRGARDAGWPPYVPPPPPLSAAMLTELAEVLDV